MPGDTRPLPLGAAIDALAELEDTRVGPFLGDLLDRAVAEERWSEAREIIEGLHAVAGPSSVAPIVGALSQGLAEVGVAAVGALAGIGSPEAIEPIREVLRSEAASEDAALRVAAVDALARFGSTHRDLVMMLRDDSPRVVASAARAVSGIDHPKARAELSSALDRIRQRMEPLRNRWESWEDWDSQEAWFDDDSPGHSTYRWERDQYMEIRSAFVPLLEAERALEEALEHHDT
jgi:HEAT repeat protein